MESTGRNAGADILGRIFNKLRKYYLDIGASISTPVTYLKCLLLHNVVAASNFCRVIRRLNT